MKDRKGIALILAVGILAVLAAIATSFALNMRLEYKAAMNYYNGVKARYLAEAALHRAIAGLKDDAKSDAFGWTSGYSESISSTATSTIVDEQRKVNINTANYLLLTNLFSELGITNASDLDSRIRQNKPAKGYTNLRELKSIAGVTEDEFNTIKSDITVSSYVDDDPGAGADTGRAPINVNTCSRAVLEAVLTDLNDGTYNISASEAGDVASDIISGSASSGNTDGRPFYSWSDFEDCLAGSVADEDIEDNDAALIINNCNPNRVAPSTNTTEFCFHSGGYYTITATGIVDGAEKTLSAIVKIYELYTETTKEQFDKGTAERVTWDDSCPVNTGALFSGSYDPAESPITIPDSIKLGYWDGDNVSTTALPGQWIWGRFRLRVYQDSSGSGSNFHDGGHIYFWGPQSGYGAGNPHVFISNYPHQEWTSTGGVDKIACFEYKNQSGYGAPVTTTDSSNNDVADITYLETSLIDGNIYEKYDYPNPALWLWPNSDGVAYPDDWNNASPQPYEYYTGLSGTTNKRLIVIDAPQETGYEKVITITAYEDAGGVCPLDNSVNSGGGILDQYTTGPISLTGNVVWEDLRIIPEGGNYTSRIIPAAGNAEWGTIEYTLTATDSAAAAGVDISLETQSRIADGEWGSWQVRNEQTGEINSAKGNAIRYRANLSTNDTIETPVLEDITITYLPKTEIVSYIISP